MPLFQLAFIVALLMVVAGCTDSPPAVENASSSPRPVKTVVVDDPEASRLRSFPGRVEAANRAAVSFRVGGKLTEIAVNEGDHVEADQVLARLDDTEYQTIVNERQASYDAARANYTRGQSLVAAGNISRMDFDRLTANYKTAEANLALARQNLDNTVLRAPFAGSVARRLVDNFEEVNPRQPIIALRNIRALEVKVNIPESLLLRVRRRAPGETDAERTQNLPVYATFDGAPGQRFPVTFKEIATEADPQTQTFEITYALPAPQELTVLPGMSTTLTFDLSLFLEEEAVFFLPVSAVTADANLDPRVWIVDEEQMTVQPRSVTVGELRDTRIAILDGVALGERVVVAGASLLSEGQAVTLMPATEQAEPRR